MAKGSVTAEKCKKCVAFLMRGWRSRIGGYSGLDCLMWNIYFRTIRSQFLSPARGLANVLRIASVQKQNKSTRLLLVVTHKPIYCNKGTLFLSGSNSLPWDLSCGGEYLGKVTHRKGNWDSNVVGPSLPFFLLGGWIASSSRMGCATLTTLRTTGCGSLGIEGHKS